jgi:hypothetical protein
MMKVWLAILPFNGEQAFFLEHSQVLGYVSAIVSTLLIASAVWCVTQLTTRWQQIERWIWLFIYSSTAFLCLNGIRYNRGWSLEIIYGALGKWGADIVMLLFLVGTTSLMFRYRYVIVKKKSLIALLLSPFLLFTFGQSLLALKQVEPESVFTVYTSHKPVLVKHANAIPVVWIIYDELDYRIAFGSRPKNLLLPEFDKFQQTSLYSSKAFSPGGFTSISIPELLIGKVLMSSTPVSANEILLTFSDGNKINFNTAKTIISDMQQRKEKIAIFGWFFPYTRLFSSVDCVKDYSISPSSDGLMENIAIQLSSLIESRITFQNPHHILITKSMQNDVINYLQTFQSGFTFLHYPVPHPDYIYSRKTKTYCNNLNQKEGYLDNLALTDRLLGEVRITMQKNGIWDKALIIVSADHHWRFNIYDGVTDTLHVPFLVKLPGQKDSLSFSDRFETVNTKEMILNIIDGKINTPEELKTWMQNKCTIRLSVP